MSKRTYTKPTFFKNEDRLFAEFADGTLYGVIVRPKMRKDPLDSREYLMVPRLQFIRIDNV